MIIFPLQSQNNKLKKNKKRRCEYFITSSFLLLDNNEFNITHHHPHREYDFAHHGML